jgi:polyisoprenoid-binding protein YceI
MKSLKIFILFITVTVYQTSSFAQTTKWGYDASHAKVSFTISHFGISETEGKFTKFDGIVLSDKPNFSDAKFNFTIDVSSINTEDAKRDQHLKSADFFDIEKYPTIVFKSKSFKSIGKNKYKLIGNITIHGVTKQITLDVIYKGTVIDPYKNTKAGFKISGVLDRTRFGLVWNGNLGTGELLVGNEVTIDINMELIKK